MSATNVGWICDPLPSTPLRANDLRDKFLLQLCLFTGVNDDGAAADLLRV